MFRCNKKYIYSLFLRFICVDIFLISFSFFYLFELKNLLNESFSTYLKITYLFLLAIIILLTFVCPYFTYKNTKYEITSTGIVVKRGILIFKEEFILNKNIQYIEINKNPFDLIFKLCTIIIYTNGPYISLTGIVYEEAIKIKDELEKYLLGENNDKI